MIISNSEVNMASTACYTNKTSVATKQTATPLVKFGNGRIISSDKEDGDFLSSLNYELGSNGKVKEAGDSSQATNRSSNYKVRLETMSYLLRLLLYGGKLGEQASANSLLEDAFNSSSEINSTQTFLCTMKSEYVYEESQSVDFSAKGTVYTADGRELTFNYSFSMTSSFREEYSNTERFLKEVTLKDPLVINLDSNPGSISDKTFLFDLDCDGEEEEISTLGAGKGFLALDLNGDGLINDGSELFGTKSGDGFKDLAKYDEDGNGWIDENDTIFNLLRIMTVDEDGKIETYGLKESDVGAIGLRRLATDFSAYNDAHEILGVIRSSGIFLHESTGAAGAIQHLDLAT